MSMTEIQDLHHFKFLRSLKYEDFVTSDMIQTGNKLSSLCRHDSTYIS